ncbi:UNVERIFIED_CONTAM: hypothetical protein Sangu_2794700 [Sesamum angustifolium]|uniref:Reverse transcriptase n=1 Tax=Sesamum angustifolium TaxID=2727405 RepID=A0AAW2ISW5_9LAMI
MTAKAKQRWLEDGDANTIFFHLTVVLQSKANSIHSIKIREDENQEICVIPTAEEIKATVFEMAGFKSSGLDGFPPIFYKRFWHIIGSHRTDATLHFFSSRQFLQAINHTYITLIPKTLRLTQLISSVPLASATPPTISSPKSLQTGSNLY